jgi:hypothetical protein
VYYVGPCPSEEYHTGDIEIENNTVYSMLVHTVNAWCGYMPDEREGSCQVSGNVLVAPIIRTSCHGLRDQSTELCI